MFFNVKSAASFPLNTFLKNEQTLCLGVMDKPFVVYFVSP